MGVPVAAYVALSMVASVSLFPPALKSRPLAYVVASTQLYVMPRSILGDAETRADPRQYAAQAVILANFLTSPELRRRIAATAGFRASRVAVDGPVPVDLPRAEVEPPGEKRANQIVVENDPYRVTVDQVPGLPEIAIKAQAPRTSEAVRLAYAVQSALSSYLSSLKIEAGLSASNGVQVGLLEPAAVSGDSSGGPLNVATATFLISLVLWTGGVYAVAAIARDVRIVRRRRLA